MCLSAFRRVPWITLCALALAAANAGHTQTASKSGSSTASSPSRSDTTAPPAPPDEIPGNRADATAECRDGFLSFDKHTWRTCIGHGGVRKWLPGGGEQALLRQ
jgi:hypothetical protein